LPSCRFDQLVEVLHLVRCLSGRKVEAAPAIAVLGDALERRAALAAEPYRHFAADRLGIAANVFEFDEFALVGAVCIAPETAHRVDILAGALRAPLPRHADRVELLLQPSDPHAQREASAA